MPAHISFFLSNSSLLAHINTIKEFPNILVLHMAFLVYQSSRARNKFNVIAIQDEFIFDLFRPQDCHSLQHVNFPYPFLAKEVSDLNTLVTISNASIDGKVSVHHPHFVSVPFGNPSDEILNMANSSPNSSSALPGPKP
uniref:Uncharacterized protein n=2 Tax=Opuntia streptacantha TaxID=393608 RepID=A0A7C9DFS6_OPUST